MFLIGAATRQQHQRERHADNLNFTRTTRDMLDSFTGYGGDSEMKNAVKLPRQVYAKWESDNNPQSEAAQRTLFDMLEDA